MLGLAWAILKYKPQWFNAVLVAVMGKTGLEALGRKAMRGQPDFITPAPGGPPARPEARSALESLERRGFRSAGSFVIPEMQNLPVHFLAKEDESSIAVVYEHPKAGVWCDLVSRYVDGSSITVTNAKRGAGSSSGRSTRRSGRRVSRLRRCTSACSVTGPPGRSAPFARMRSRPCSHGLTPTRQPGGRAGACRPTRSGEPRSNAAHRSEPGGRHTAPPIFFRELRPHLPGSKHAYRIPDAYRERSRAATRHASNRIHAQTHG